MRAEGFDVDALIAMAHSPLRNYIVPGLDSYLIGNPSPAGTVRLFRCSRWHQESITPHSHRFNFQCWVLRGWVRQVLWEDASLCSYLAEDDMYMRSVQKYLGVPGKYEISRVSSSRYLRAEETYQAGECYSMTHDEIHSIYFSKGAEVLFFEGPQVSDTSVFLEPVVNGEVIPTLKTEPWMFQRD